jgi:hypothetical protein
LILKLSYFLALEWYIAFSNSELSFQGNTVRLCARQMGTLPPALMAEYRKSGERQYPYLAGS